MKEFKKIFLRSYKTIVGSIAFLPTLMVSMAIILAIIMLYFEYSAPSQSIKNAIEVALVKNSENARLILGTIVGGIISLTVFSFSMVMVVLNRTSATLSPRVIPGIISKKSHQVVLGFYLSTIIYSLLMIININTVETGFDVPALGIFVAMLFAIISLGLFVYFIDSISQVIQVDNILDSIYRNTLKKIKKSFNNVKDVEEGEVNDDQWHYIPSSEAGFFNALQVKDLVKFLQKEDLKLKVNTTKGFFIPEGYPYLAVNKNILQESKKIKHITSMIILQSEEHFREHYNFGFKQISEIAVKALSPAINDPGTANKAIDLLTLLFIERMKISNFNIVRDKEGVVRIIFSEWNYSELLYQNIAQIRNYGSSDVVVMCSLLNMIKNLFYADHKRKFSNVLVKQAGGIIEDVKYSVTNSYDLEVFNKSIEGLNKISTKTFDRLPL